MDDFLELIWLISLSVLTGGIALVVLVVYHVISDSIAIFKMVKEITRYNAYEDCK